MQARYQCAIIKDRSALTRGTTTLQQGISIPLGQAYEFEVTICGNQSPVCSGPSPTIAEPVPEANANSERQVWVGANMSVVLTGDMPGQINNQSQRIQPVISDTDSATWFWELDPTQAGTFDLTLTVTPLLANTDTPLKAAVPYPIRLTVTESTGQRLTTAVKSGSSFIEHLAEGLGALGLTAAGIGAWFWQRVRRRRAQQSEPQPKTLAPADGPSDAEQAPEDTAVIPSDEVAPSRADSPKTASD